MFCRSYSYDVLDKENLCRVVCFPSFDDVCCRSRVEELTKLGIEYMYSFGDVVLWNGVRVVGKGHASVIVLAHHAVYGDIGLKIRRVDSKRLSLEYEGFLLEKAVSRFAPKVYAYSRDFLLREYVDGCTLEKFVVINRYSIETVSIGLINLLKGALELDLLGIDLAEISKPLKQVIYRCCKPDEPIFIDFESAKISLKPLNITKIVNFLINGVIEGTKVRDIVKLNEYKLGKVLEIAKQYKNVVDKELRKKLVEDLIALLRD